jgi:hypothetical protein
METTKKTIPNQAKSERLLELEHKHRHALLEYEAAKSRDVTAEFLAGYAADARAIFAAIIEERRRIGAGEAT